MVDKRATIKFIRIIVLSAGLIFVGCIAMVNNFETAQTLPNGQSQFGISISPIYYTFSYVQEHEQRYYFMPITELIYKRGFGENDNRDMGIGLRLYWYWPTLFINSKYQFLNDKIDGAVSFEGALAAYWDPEETDVILHLKPTVLFSKEKAKALPFRIATSVDFRYWYYGNYPDYNVSLICNLGFPIRFGEKRKYRIIPDIGVAYRLLYHGDSPGHIENDKIIGQAGISFAYVGLEKK